MPPMKLRALLLVGAVLVALGQPARPAKADPAVTGIAIASVPLLLWSLFEKEPTGRDPDLLSLNAGIFDIVDDEDRAVTFGMEYRSNLWLWKFKPIIGAAGTTDRSGYFYAGLRLDAYFGKRFVISPSLAPTLYHYGSGKDLGSPAVLRSGLDFAYRFDNKSELGVGFHHMSHGKVFGNLNPGTETVHVFYAIPLSSLFGTK
jgi:lipid A 3-O-deacylase